MIAPGQAHYQLDVTRNCAGFLGGGLALVGVFTAWPASAATATPTHHLEPAAPSTLSAETAALDAARKASAAGAFHRALSPLAQYQQDFPHGVLRAAAEVASIQILSASGDHAQAVRRAMQFLAEYPNDPHSATLKLLLAR